MCRQQVCTEGRCLVELGTGLQICGRQRKALAERVEVVEREVSLVMSMLAYKTRPGFSIKP